MLDSLVVAYMQFVTTLTELQKVLSQELQCLCSKTTAVLSEWYSAPLYKHWGSVQAVRPIGEVEV